MSEISQEQLQQILSRSGAQNQAANWVGPLNTAFQRFSINTPQRQAAFLAQVLLESSEFQALSENLNYSAPRLRQVWPSRFPTDEIAAVYANNPEKLANKIYANRLGNGDEASGDGWKYRGRGLIQLTGRSNYQRCQQTTGLDLIENPDLLAQPGGACLSAAWFWNSNSLNELADQISGNNATDITTQITRRVNGGTIGLQERLNYWGRAWRVLGDN